MQRAEGKQERRQVRMAWTWVMDMQIRWTDRRRHSWEAELVGVCRRTGSQGGSGDGAAAISYSDGRKWDKDLFKEENSVAELWGQ